ncbi:hypothetical protein, conserved [Eimeria tenella]|uniref:Uncharacterized protein n=1 Tax=Eimeria tenella TaxID=5802 RepID=U6KYA2_EIMTE|nr:hypothetical protein, conserved [Eimeria tenella]CDJ41329.1 hypothetical protein, conserved [Eimeria tenella]|eukprot:XP_013232079.1 hypothetical protein, conserved [Eimeria tenella]
MHSNTERLSAWRHLWAIAVVAFLLVVAPAARKRPLRQEIVDGATIEAPQASLHRWWTTLQEQVVAADSTRAVSSEYVSRLPADQQDLCERFSQVCLDSVNGDDERSSSETSSSRRDSSLRERVFGIGLAEMTDFALAAPFLLASKWTAFTEMVLSLGILKDKYLSRFAALQEKLAPFLLITQEERAETAAAATRPPSRPRTHRRQSSKRGKKHAVHEASEHADLAPQGRYSAAGAAVADAAAATAAAAAAEGTDVGIDMEYVRISWTELQQLAEEERQVASTYLALAAEGNLFHSAPDDCLWEALLQQVVIKATAAASAAKSGLTATFPDLYREGTEGYNTAFAALAAADDHIRLLLSQQQDTYAGSQPVLFFLRGILLSICEGGECTGVF